MGIVRAGCKGRAHDFLVLKQVRESTAVAVVGGFVICDRWVPTGLNTADAASRRLQHKQIVRRNELQTPPQPHRLNSSSRHGGAHLSAESAVPGSTRMRSAVVADGTARSRATPASDTRSTCSTIAGVPKAASVLTESVFVDNNSSASRQGPAYRTSSPPGDFHSFGGLGDADESKPYQASG